MHCILRPKYETFPKTIGLIGERPAGLLLLSKPHSPQQKQIWLCLGDWCVAAFHVGETAGLVTVVMHR